MLIPVAVFCTRFRDFPQIVGNALQIMFFATPIMWRPETLLRTFHWIAEFNPLAHLIDIVRLPLLGMAPGWGHGSGRLPFLSLRIWPPRICWAGTDIALPTGSNPA